MDNAAYPKELFCRPVCPREMIKESDRPFISRAAEAVKTALLEAEQSGGSEKGAVIRGLLFPHDFLVSVASSPERVGLVWVEQQHMQESVYPFETDSFKEYTHLRVSFPKLSSITLEEWITFAYGTLRCLQECRQVCHDSLAQWLNGLVSPLPEFLFRTDVRLTRETGDGSWNIVEEVRAGHYLRVAFCHSGPDLYIDLIFPEFLNPPVLYLANLLSALNNIEESIWGSTPRERMSVTVSLPSRWVVVAARRGETVKENDSIGVHYRSSSDNSGVSIAVNWNSHFRGETTSLKTAKLYLPAIILVLGDTLLKQYQQEGQQNSVLVYRDVR